jgi:hypothetical protein
MITFKFKKIIVWPQFLDIPNNKNPGTKETWVITGYYGKFVTFFAYLLENALNFDQIKIIETNSQLVQRVLSLISFGFFSIKYGQEQGNTYSNFREKSLIS